MIGYLHPFAHKRYGRAFNIILLLGLGLFIYGQHLSKVWGQTTGFSSTRIAPQTLNIGMIQCHTQSGFSTNKALKAFCQMLEAHPELDILIAPEWFLTSRKGMLNPKQMGNIQKVLEARTKNRNILVIPGSAAWSDGQRYQNTALVISNGQTLLNYSKRNDGGDSWFARNNNITWQPGLTAGIFNWRGLKVGLEICADHNRLKNGDNVSDLDLHLVISCGMSFSPSNAAMRLGGLGMICDGNSPKTEVYQQGSQAISRTAGSLQPIPIESESPILFTHRPRPLTSLGVPPLGATPGNSRNPDPQMKLITFKAQLLPRPQAIPSASSMFSQAGLWPIATTGTNSRASISAGL